MMDTIVWISGATEGVGLGLASTVPYPGARIINLSRRSHPTLETVQFDLTRPETYAAVQASFEQEFGFKGKRAIFIHNAYYPGKLGFVSEVDPTEYAKCIQANAVAPQILGDLFLRAVKGDFRTLYGAMAASLASEAQLHEQGLRGAELRLRAIAETRLRFIAGTAQLRWGSAHPRRPTPKNAIC